MIIEGHWSSFGSGLALWALGAVGCASLLLAPLELVQPPTAISAFVNIRR